MLLLILLIGIILGFILGFLFYRFFIGYTLNKDKKIVFYELAFKSKSQKPLIMFLKYYFDAPESNNVNWWYIIN